MFSLLKTGTSWDVIQPRIMQPTGNVKSTPKLGVMAPKKILYPQILSLEKKGPWGTVSGSKSQLLFPGYQSHWILFLISKNDMCMLNF